MKASHVISIVLLIGCLLPVGTGFKWTAGPDSDFPLRPCPGDNVTLNWDFDLAEDDILTSIQWLLLQGTKAPKPVAYASPFGQFFQMPHVNTRMELVPPAGLRLYNVSTRDLGTYSVEVDLFTNGTRYTNERSVTLAMPETPMLSEGRLEARLEPGTVTINGTSHARLACGTILNHQHAEFSVAWKTPSGQTVDSSYHAEGVSYLVLENPVEGGEYNCFLQGPTSFTCRPKGSSVGKVQVYQLETRLSVLETRAGRHDNQLQHQNRVDEDLTLQVSSVRAALEQETQRLDTRVDMELGNLTAEHAQQLSAVNSSLNTLDTRVGSLDTELANLTAEHAQQLSAVNSSLNTLDTRVASLDTELANLTAEHAQQLSAVNSSLNTLDTRVGSLDTELANLTAEYSQQLSAVNSSLNTLDTRVASLDTELANLTAEHAQQLSAVNSSLNTLDTRVASLDTELANLTAEHAQQLSAVNSSLNTLDTRVASLDTELANLTAEHAQQLSAVNSSLNTLDTRVGSLDTELANLTAEHTQKLVAMEKMSKDMEGDLKDLIQQQAALIQQQAATIQQHTAAIKNLRTRLDAVDNKVQKQGREVAFTAYSGRASIPASISSIIVFGSAKQNTGNAYGTSTGVFTAPVEGLYFFIVNVDLDGTYRSLALKKNGQIVLRGHDDTKREHITTSGVFRLNAGDKVAMYHNTGSGAIDGGQESTFSGFLLR